MDVGTFEVSAPKQEYVSYVDKEQLDFTKYFGSVYVINLKTAKERMLRISEELKSIGVTEFTRFEAVDGRKEVPESIWRKFHCNWQGFDTTIEEEKRELERQFQGEAGCYLSHLGVLQEVRSEYKKAKEEYALSQSADAARRIKKYSSVLILEDDNGFGFVDSTGISVTTKKVGLVFRRAMEELPEDWDMFYLMADALEPSERYSEHLAKLQKGNTANAVAINHTMYDRLCRQLERVLDPDGGKVYAVDGEYNSLHPTTNSYAIVPSIAYQQSGFSGILSKTAPRVRQEQSIDSELAALYGDLLPEDVEILRNFDINKAFQDEAFSVEKLSQDNDRGFFELTQRIALQFKHYVDAQKLAGTPHDFTAKKQKELLVESYSLSMGGKDYLMHECPKKDEEIENFFEGILQRNITLLVSTIKSYEMPERIISYFPKGVDTIKTKSGWTIKAEPLRLVEESKHSHAKLYAITLLAVHDNGDKRELSYLHYDGWQRCHPLPDRALMQKLLDLRQFLWLATSFR